MRDSGARTVGIRDLKVRPDGFSVLLFAPPEKREALSDPATYRVRRYRHVYQGAYHSPPTDEESLNVAKAIPSPDGLEVRLVLREPLIVDRIHEIRLDVPGAQPPLGHYTLNRIPRP